MRKIKFLLLCSIIACMSCLIVQMYLNTQIKRNELEIHNMALRIENKKGELQRSENAQIILLLTIDEEFIQELSNLRLKNQSTEDYIEGFNELMEQKYDFSGHREMYEGSVK